MASGAAKTIYVVEGVGEVAFELYSCEEVTAWLAGEGIAYLVNVANDEAISGYADLEHNGRYKRGPPIAKGNVHNLSRFFR